MKLQGILGGGTGKLGESVFTNNAGRTIVRQYNPHVRNPRTVRQQNSRGRFTVASELAKQFALALKIGMPRIGALTSRNRFTSMVIPTSANVINLTGNELVPDYSVMPLSKGGMPAVPVVDVQVDTTSSGLRVTLSEAYNPVNSGYVPPMAGAAGLVVVLSSSTTKESVVRQLPVTTGLEYVISDVVVAGGVYDHAHIFAKWVPDSYNDITSSNLPWKFPSDQSATVSSSIEGI